MAQRFGELDVEIVGAAGFVPWFREVVGVDERDRLAIDDDRHGQAEGR